MAVWRRNTLVSTVVVAGICVSPAAQALDHATLNSWGMETYSEIERTLSVSNTALYSETTSLDGSRTGSYGYSYVWPAATQMRVLDTLTAINPATYAPTLRQFSDQVYSAYWNNGYQSGAGPSERFYDDNAHVVVSLVEAYRATHDTVYLTRAQQTEAFVLSGEDSAGGGGIYFDQTDDTFKDAISTLQGARGAAMLYRETGDSSYLNDATRLLTWANTHIQQTDGLFDQHYSTIDNSGASGIPLVNSAGIGITTNLELYEATNSRTYLLQAERIATRSLTRYFDSATGRINDEGYWAFELADAFEEMRIVEQNSLWETKLDTALAWLHDNKRDPNGHYGVLWGNGGTQTTALTSWALNDQASVAQAYLQASIVGTTTFPILTPEPAAVGIMGILSLTLRRRRTSMF
jgi:hypothetical protein